MAWPSKITGSIATSATQYGGDMWDKFLDLVQKAGSEIAEILDTNFKLADPTDTTKLMRIDCGSIGTGQERVLTMPDKNITPGDDVEGVQEDTIYADSMSDADGTTNAKAEYAEEFTTTNKTPIAKMKFDTAADEYCFAKWRPPKNWNAGVVKVKAKWGTAAGLAAETIELEVSAVAIGNDDAIDAAYGTAVALTDTFIAQGDQHETAYSSDLTVAGTPAKGDTVYFKIMRDVSADDLTGDLELLELIIQYTIDAATAV